MVYVIFIFFTGYFIFLFMLWFGWSKAMLPAERKTLNTHFLSVIIPVRNEADTISFLIEDLKNQTHSSFEVIFVNDHSTDQTAGVITEKISGLVNFRMIINAGAGKKHALTTGIAAAKGFIIITTDGDCRLSKEWLSEVNNGFANHEVKMVFGAVRMRSNGFFFGSLQVHEFASIIGTGAAAHALGMALYCNGANLAFRKETFLEVNGYAGNLHIASGDDEFLMRKIKTIYPKGILFLNTSESIVETLPNSDLLSFLHQRIRWAGKWRLAPSLSKVTAIGVFLFHLLFLGCLAWLCIGNYPTLLPVLILVKIFAEFIFLFKVCMFLNVRWRTFHFLILQVTYSVYVVTIGMLANFMTFTWKGRATVGSVR
ncbi:MAG TPA: glycosyltransferase [Ohtaekwangia sp.]|nr:glycosyltransferase [Ohtaekwangia sp.]